MSNVNEIYDALFTFESKNRLGSYPIHKRLVLPQHDDLIDWLIEEVEFDHDDSVWDAGCGVGFSLLKLGPLVKNGYGCSLSGREIAFANSTSKAQGLNDKLLFEQASFEEPQSRRYSKILMIESLKHTADLETTLDNVLAALLPGGQLIIADDFTTNENVSVAYHRKLWSVPNFCSFERIEQLIHSKGEFEIQSHDFTNQVPVRNALLLNVSIVILRSILKLGLSQNQNLRTYLGALLLEQLYVRKQTSYKVIIARKVG